MWGCESVGMNVRYAHTTDGLGKGSWQEVSEHVANVGQLAGEFAAPFGYKHWGHMLGVLHDAGKISEHFQNRLTGESTDSYDHAALGAEIVENWQPTRSTEAYARMLMQYPILGHHGGMPNGVKAGKRTPRVDRLKSWEQSGPESVSLLDEFDAYRRENQIYLPAFADLEDLLPLCDVASPEDVPYAIYAAVMTTKMLYSCLVDADYLDTESFVCPDMATARSERSTASIAQLSRMLDDHLAELRVNAPATPVNAARALVGADCVASAEGRQGIFTLTVPTGGGKTLASMAFALHHALKHGLRRVIMAIPYTSIVEQTAKTLRSVFGDENVLEHHSNYDFDALDERQRKSEMLATQNWDAPIIVTTNVQLLESFYSNRPGKSRKIHNVAKSVVIFDEAQSIPDPMLKPSLAVMEWLTRSCSTTVVLCTATQPVLESVWPFGSKAVEISSHQDEVRGAFGVRTKFQIDNELLPKDVAREMSGCHQALCIVGTKKKAFDIFQLLCEELGLSDGWEVRAPHEVGVFHLSTNMTPLHRMDVIADIRRRLNADEQCLVVSTQLIEAGVDVDFPVVYREIAGLDSLVQAAGRCNREGRREYGVVHVLDFEHDLDDQKATPRNWLETMKSQTRSLIRKYGCISEEQVPEFFLRRYRGGNLDAKGLVSEMSSSSLLFPDCFAGLNYEEWASSYKLIEDSTVPVFIPWGDGGRRLYAELRHVSEEKDPAVMASRLQRSSVGLPTNDFYEYVRLGVIDDVTYAPINVMELERDAYKVYDSETGVLRPESEVPSNLIS